MNAFIHSKNSFSKENFTDYFRRNSSAETRIEPMNFTLKKVDDIILIEVFTSRSFSISHRPPTS